jgi:hypothetical protein
MPSVSAFYGIVIYFYYAEPEHEGKPHFHARCAEHKASIEFDGTVIAGSLPRPELRLVRRWAALHQSELAATWRLAADDQPLPQIAPLP